MGANSHRWSIKKRLLQNITELEELLRLAKESPENPDTALAVEIITQQLEDEKERLQSFE